MIADISHQLSLKHILEAMSAPLGEILIHTYGLFNSDRLPLVKVAERLSKPLEEVEKLRIMGIRRLRDPKLAFSFARSHEEFEEEIWQQLSDADCLYVMREGAAEWAMDHLSGEIALELAVRYGSVGDCLKRIAVTTDKSWIRSEYGLDEIKDTIALLTRLSDKYRLPRPFHTLVMLSGKAPELLAVAVVLSTHFEHGGRYGFYRGYVIDAPARAHSIRIVRLHRLMCRYWAHELVSTQRMIDVYRERFSDDDLDSAAAFQGMQTAPFLFLKTSYHHWICVRPDDAFEHPTLGADLEFNSIFFKTGLEEESARATVISILRDKAPVTDKELMRELISRSNARYGYNHLGNIYNNECGIIYLSPGVLGLEEMAADLCTQDRAIEKLLNKKDCKHFIAARAAGEPRDLYLLWNIKMEYQWCRWAENHLSARDFEALLFVSEPGQWPVEQSERERWINKKRTLGRYRPSHKRVYKLDKATPSLKRLYQIAVYTKIQGDISWVRVNWITRMQLSEPSRPGTLLAFLVVLEVLDQVEHWCFRHHVGVKIDDFIERLNQALYLEGSLKWNSTVGREILDSLRAAETRTDFKLIAPHQIHGFVRGVEREIEASVGEADQPTPETAIISDNGLDTENGSGQGEQLPLF